MQHLAPLFPNFHNTISFNQSSISFSSIGYSINIIVAYIKMYGIDKNILLEVNFKRVVYNTA